MIITLICTNLFLLVYAIEMKLEAKFQYERAESYFRHERKMSQDAEQQE